MPGDWLLLAFLISYCIAFDPWTWTLILGLWKLWCEQLCTNCTGGSSNASASAFLFFKHTHFNVISTPLCWHSVYTLYIQCIIDIYVFVCSFHVLQYAWNHLYHNHMPETLKLYFKKHNATLDWKESLTEGFRATFLYQSKFEFTKKCYIIIIIIIIIVIIIIAVYLQNISTDLMEKFHQNTTM